MALATLLGLDQDPAHGYRLANLPNPEADPGGTPHSGRTPPRWCWTFPSGLTHTDEPDPPLGVL